MPHTTSMVTEARESCKRTLFELAELKATTRESMRELMAEIEVP
jgi:hypothetical protein